ncbi:alpha/beta hydrolase [Malaciobacter molluscorum]|uniref:alpha/beta hydrolase n=1 Tax=Malaciobacter molluscorum TaxID=1032072 RepID=UPI00100BE2E0|nr:alpha/beta fold hydrolase [Malaciobacter molluscorum]RXJ94597.1 alpha/beta hydrolase [Malaciobacter molluscorum]
MLKKIFISSLVVGISLLNAQNITKNECEKLGNEFIYAGGECINYKKYSGEQKDKLNIVVHGTWDEGTNVLGRYAPFAENLSFETDVPTIAVALPGYSKSSLNNLKSIGSKTEKNLVYKKEYLSFLSSLITAFKSKYNAKTITYIGHSAGCSIGATLLGKYPSLINNLLCAGGKYDIHKSTNEKDLISAIDVIDNVDKNSKIALVYGTKDTISKPEVTKEFYKIAKEKGLNVKLIEVKDAVHLDLDMTQPSVNAIIELDE